MYEVYHQPEVETPDYASMHHLALHFAYSTEDIDADFARLKAAGATVVQDPTPTDAGRYAGDAARSLGRLRATGASQREDALRIRN